MVASCGAQPNKHLFYTQKGAWSVIHRLSCSLAFLWSTAVRHTATRTQMVHS